MPTVAPSNFASPSSQTAPTAVNPAAMWAQACLNCGSSLTGPFCAECGQRAVPPHPSLRELAGDAFAEFSGWDGKFAETIRALLFRPGRLTLEFLDGRRARYITPLRLYLVSSLVYFALAAATPETTTTTIKSGKVGGKAVSMSTTVPAVKATNAPATTPQAAQTSANHDPNPDPDSTIDPKDRDAQIASVPRIFQPVVRRSLEDPTGFRHELFNSLPKALFALLPVFAGILKLLYPARRFAEHLYYALHVHAFLFLALSLSALAKLTHLAPVEATIGLVVFIAVPFYWHRALRRVYGGSFGATLVKETGIGLLYGAASIPVLIGLAIWVSASG